MKDHAYYDELRAANAQSLERRGTVDFVPASASLAAAAGGSEEDVSGNSIAAAEAAEQEELALCHLAAMWRYSTLDEDSETGELTPRSLGPGFYGDSASVLMAINHFNNGMGIVVDEVEGINERCNFRFTVDFHDTFSSETRAITTMTDIHNRGDPKPCAVLGAFRSAVSTPLSILTGVYGLPQLSPISSSPALDDTNLHPLFSRLVPSDAGTSLLTAKYLLELGTKHVGVINVDDAYGNAYQKAFKRIGEAEGLTVEAFSFGFKPSKEEISTAIAGLKATRYRYFFAIIFGPEHFDIVMTEAYKQGLAGNGETFWIYGGGVQRYVQNIKYRAGSPLALATQGGAMIQADGGIDGMPGFDRYLKAWKRLGRKDIDYFNSKQPNGYYIADVDYFKRNEPERESIFSYDSVISMGLAACALLNRTRGFFDGRAHFEQIVTTTNQFVGASGTVVIDPATTSRDPESALYVIFNAVSNEPDENGMVSYDVGPAVIHQSTEDGWESYKESQFIFNDNTTVPPEPLPRLDINMNYIGTGLRAAGIAMSVLVVLGAIFFGIWTLVERNARIVRASQPIFLVIICGGVFLMGLSIVPLSFDDEIASSETCNALCMAVPWLYCTGFALCFAALYAKTRRIYILLQQKEIRRIKVNARDVMLPLALLLVANVVVLTVWTAVSPLKWKRETRTGKDEFGRNIESYAGCLVGSNAAHIPYIVTLIVLDAGLLLFANVQAYVARDIRTEYSESRFIGIAMISMLQTWAIGIPVLFVTNGDPQAQFLVLTCIIFVCCLAILALILLPKYLMRKKKRKIIWEKRSSVQLGLEVTTSELEREKKSVRISGLDDSSQARIGKLICFGESSRNDDSHQRLPRNHLDVNDEVERQESERSSITASSDITRDSAGNPALGIRIVPHKAEQENKVLKANVMKLKRDKEDLLNEMNNLLESAPECPVDDFAIRIDRTVLERKLMKFQ